MERATVFVLTRLFIDQTGHVTSSNVGLTFSLHEAEHHKSEAVENDFEAFRVDCPWQEHVATTDLVFAMRSFRDMVRTLEEEALR